MSAEKYVVAARMWNLGFIKGETAHQGNVIEVDRAANTMQIDGRKFNDLRDIDIALRHAKVNPGSPLIVPCTPENLARLKVPVKVVSRPKPSARPMAVVQSDEDEHDTIDISDTQVSKRTAAAKEAERGKAQGGKLEVIRGDETPAEVAERVAAKLNEKLPVVRDDSLGADTSGESLNKGQRLPSPGVIKEKEARAMQEAAARKELARRSRTVGAVDAEDMNLVLAAQDEDAPAAGAPSEVDVLDDIPAPEAEALTAEDVAGQVEALRAELAAKFDEVVAELRGLAKPSTVEVVRVPVRRVGHRKGGKR